MYYHFIVRLLNKKKYDEAADLAGICYRCVREEQVEEGFNNPILQIEAKRYYNYLCFAVWRSNHGEEKCFIDKLR